MDGLSGDLDYLRDDVTQTELDEWLQTTDVFEQDVECSRSSEKATSSSAQFPMNLQLQRQSSLDDVRPDEEMFGISIPTSLRAARQLGVELASIDFDNTKNAGVSSSSPSSSQLPTSRQPVIGLKNKQPTCEFILFQKKFFCLFSFILIDQIIRVKE